MPATKKRKKVTRMHGSHTHGRGFKKKARGSGHRGGVGMAGTGKRGDQKKTLVTKMFGGKYFGKDRTIRQPKRVRMESITLAKINNDIEKFVKKGIAKETKGNYEIDLKKYKVIGNTEFKIKVTIYAGSASSGAVKSVEKSGGKIVLG